MTDKLTAELTAAQWQLIWRALGLYLDTAKSARMPVELAQAYLLNQFVEELLAE